MTLLLPNERELAAVEPLAALAAATELTSDILVELRPVRRGSRPAWSRTKRVVDIVLALAGLILAMPILVLAAIAIKIDDGGPVLFRQERVGYLGRSFRMLKLRSMVVDAEKRRTALIDLNKTDGLLFKIDDDPRITRVGRVLRRLSIDELPQLCNVLAGTMSLVGPRPLPVSPEEFGFDAAGRHDALPGITGAWQVEGGPSLSYRQMLDLDLEYIRSWTIARDLVLLARTVPALVRRHGVC